jgi:hypothetical protein
VQTVKKLPVRARPRPYADPYRGHEPWEGDSVLSSWSVDDKVNRGQHLPIYQCQTASQVGFLISWISLPTKTMKIGTSRIKVISQY